MTQEQLYAIALTKVQNISVVSAKYLYQTLGSAAVVYENRQDIKACIPDATPRMAESIKQIDSWLGVAEKELEFAEKKNIRVLTLNDPAYPQRLKSCDDAPIVLYYCGNADLNKAKMISMVGTRKCNEYGKDLCRLFVEELHQYLPDAIIVSGLAYGIDIHSHRAALANGMETVGVLAHSLDRIYPSVHRQTAVEMASHGGLLTEYMSGTSPERYNFLARNRIVAGMTDATIVVQSAKRGGSLVTADLAIAYNRELFAFPSKIYDEESAGCNRLIRDNKAQMITSAEDFLDSMGWKSSEKINKEPIQQELFTTLSEEELQIVKALDIEKEKLINEIVRDTGIAYSRVSALMFELEMKGVVEVLGGARYKLLKKI